MPFFLIHQRSLVFFFISSPPLSPFDDLGTHTHTHTHTHTRCVRFQKYPAPGANTASSSVINPSPAYTRRSQWSRGIFSLGSNHELAPISSGTLYVTIESQAATVVRTEKLSWPYLNNK
ncbi:hypothetical protein GGR52DRAFT_545220 [Hypoxylon sp. FL1284]|nr:hypothetical protein GGR52DRAFT_545220 [Hypoxylon sp. FL1284]